MRRDEVYLRHILDVISNIEKFMEGVSEKAFLAMLRSSMLFERS